MKLRLLLGIMLAAAGYGQPRLLFSEADRDRINALAAQQSWASAARTAILQTADGWPRTYTTRFGLDTPAIPPEGGQWWHHYVCPVHGVRLAYSPPNTHRCPIDSRQFTGWPYDQVVYYERHGMLGTTARDLGLAYQLTGRIQYAQGAAAILKEYAAKYPTYALHDINNRTARSGARMGAQTLDESIWLIAIAWAYDLIRNSGALTAEDQRTIERDLIRASAATVRGNDMNISNWQSWHNAGMAAAGFTLNDADLIRHAIDGPSGFRFQMQRSVVDEGFWYEGAWGYHFYALDALTQTAEMATRNGIDLWTQEPVLTSLFRTPMRLMFPDGSLPMFNDTGALNLFSQSNLYETAYRRAPDPSFLSILNRGRGRGALLWGAEELPPVSNASGQAQKSEIFESAGFAVLRTPSSDHTVMMKFGPHGGGHGHYDKLGIISYANGGPMAHDPGTQAYAAPTHATWDKTTVAHNTMVVDEQQQREAAGKLLWWQVGEGFSAVSADAGPAYPQARLTRTLVNTGRYLLDISEATATDSASHTFDWVYHNPGTVKTDLALAPWNEFGRANGYQHLTGNRGATVNEPWKLTFDGTPTAPITYGTIWASTAEVRAKFEISTAQAFRGQASARAAYEFSGAGYLLLTTPLLTGVPQEKPAALRMQVYGDGSGHRLTLRLHDSTDERFVATVGAVNWTGWKEVEVRNPESWSHFGGNNDGVFDGAVRNVTVVIDRVANGPVTGEWFIDDVTLDFEGEPLLVADFEGHVRHMRLWMLDSDGATVITGNGLGYELTKPMPYVMARRKGASARFVTLLEPYRDQPAILEFRETEPGVYLIRGEEFTDHVVVRPGGVDLVQAQ
ncbi:MAG: heparinase II/III family protein [Bryobacterales bacterium]|nr:heparinase II/III family protein [Bryobacterales bacterium]